MVKGLVFCSTSKENKMADFQNCDRYDYDDDTPISPRTMQAILDKHHVESQTTLHGGVTVLDEYVDADGCTIRNWIPAKLTYGWLWSFLQY